MTPQLLRLRCSKLTQAGPPWSSDVGSCTCAADVQLLRCLRRAQQPQPQQLAAHEARKSHNVLCHALARMVACISVTPLLGPLPAAPVRLRHAVSGGDRFA